jgi:hypothetical protein
MASLNLSGKRKQLARWAESFFNKANALIEKTPCAARQKDCELDQLQRTLGRRMEQLAVTNRELRRGVIRRKVMERTFATTERQHRKSLGESLELQKR